jgi:hypothetical protein
MRGLVSRRSGTPVRRSVHTPAAYAGLAVLAGLWLVLFAAFGEGALASSDLRWSDVASCALVVAVAFTQAQAPRRLAVLGWVVAGVGAWVTVSPFTAGESAATTANHVITGVVILVAGTASAVSGRGETGPGTTSGGMGR